MASRSLGVLSLDIIARIGGYTAGLDKAEKEAAKRAKAIEGVFDKAAIGVGVAFGVMASGAIAAFAAINRGVDVAASFADLSEEIGASAEDIASFSVAAATAGVDIESFAAASIKLTKSLVGVDDESKAAGAALAALGINIADFKRLDPAAQYEAVGKALAGYADGAEKTAVAVALFGKSGAEQLKVFKALEEQGGRTKILTAEQIAQADSLRDAQAKLTAELQLYIAAISTQFIGPMNILIGLVNDAAKEVLGLGGSVSDLGRNTGLQSFAENAGRAFAGVIDYVVTTKRELANVGDIISSSAQAFGKFASGDVAGGRKVGEDFRARMGIDGNGMKIAGAVAAKTFTQRFDEELKRNNSDRNRALLNASNYGVATDNRPRVSFSGAVKKAGGGGGADDPTKKLLENDLAAFKAQADAAKDLLAERNKFLDLYNQQGLLSVKDYYSQLQANLDEATASQAKSIDDQIAALQKYKAAAKKDTDVADASGKINKLEEEKAKLYRASGSAAIESSFKQADAQKQVLAAFNEVNAKILEYQGNLRAAGEIRFDAQNEKLIAQAQAEGNTEIVKRIGLLKQYTLAQADINKLQSQFSLAQGDLQIAEERITIARERGTMGEIESLKASGEARKTAVAIMEKQLAVFQAIDAAARTPEQTQAIERLKVQLEGLKATVDPLADKFNTMFSDAAGNAFGDFITGTKTAKEAFADFTKAVFNDISRLIAKNLAKQLFNSLLGGDSSSGGSGGLGGFLSSLFGGSVGGGGGYSGADMAGLDKLIAGFERGGFTGHGAANDPAGIVHKGEYVLTAEQTRRIGVGNLDSGNFGGGQVVNFAIDGSVNQRTQTQIAQRMRRTQLAAAARF